MASSTALANAAVGRLSITEGIAGATGALQGLLFDGAGELPSDLLMPASIGVAKLRQVIPWQKVYDFTAELPKTETGKWMDSFIGQPGTPFRHRWKGHHFFEDGMEVLSDPELSILELPYELAVDAVTVSGLPLLTLDSAQLLAKATGIPFAAIEKLAFVNALDVAIGAVTLADAATDLFLVLSGQAEWGLQTFVFTFGTGIAEIAAAFAGSTTGVAMANPLLLISGAGEIAAGSIAAYKYYSQPFLFGVPVSDLLSGLGVGAGLGAAAGVVSFAVSSEEKSVKRFLSTVGRGTTVSAILGALSAISPWISLPVGITLSASQLAWRLAARDAHDLPVSSGWSLRECFSRVCQSSGLATAMRLLKGVDPCFGNDYNSYVAEVAGRTEIASLDPVARRMLDEMVRLKSGGFDEQD